MPYVYLLLKIYASLRKIQPYNPQKSSDVFVSVIVACRNEENNLQQLLSDLAQQDHDPVFFELIIIDDNSTDRTFEIASGFTGIKNLKVMKNTGSGKKKAIRAGVKASKGELIVTTDADCKAGKYWLKTIASYYSEKNPEMIIGPVEIKGTEGFLQRFQELEFLSLQGVTAGTTLGQNPVMCNGANLAFTKKAYQGSSGDLHDDKVSGDDVFLLHSIKQERGNSIVWLESPEAIVTTNASGSWKSFLNQRARWISKAGSYSDAYTIILSIATFVTAMLLPLLLIAGIFKTVFLPVFIAAFILKSIPDYFILCNTAKRYGRVSLMKWFILSQILYSWYVFRIVTGAIFSGNKWR